MKFLMTNSKYLKPFTINPKLFSSHRENPEKKDDLKLTVFKFLNTKDVVIKSKQNIESYFSNKNILAFSPYPSKERLNSKAYDELIRSISIFSNLSKKIESEKDKKVLEEALTKHKELDKKTKTIKKAILTKSTEEIKRKTGNEQINIDKITINKDTEDNNSEALNEENLQKLTEMDKQILAEENKLMDEEVIKIKYINSFDEVIGISNMSDEETQNFIINNRISNITLIADPDNIIMKSNSFPLRYEMIINEGKICKFSEDPTVLSIFLFGVFNIFFISLTLYYIYDAGINYSNNFKQFQDIIQSTKAIHSFLI